MENVYQNPLEKDAEPVGIGALELVKQAHGIDQIYPVDIKKSIFDVRPEDDPCLTPLSTDTHDVTPHPSYPTPATESSTDDSDYAGVSNAVAMGLRKGMVIRSFNQVCADGARMPDPRNLYEHLWHEGELTALYADTNVGKSILAVQIGEQVARMGLRTLYVDLEMNDKGIEMRSRDENGTIHNFPDEFFRMNFSYDRNSELPMEYGLDSFPVLNHIEEVGRELSVRALIIDNITALCSGIESGDMAVRFVNRLLKMRDCNNWSILFLAHTPKLDRTLPITRDSMAGSKRVISLIDSAFAIGEIADSPGLRYIKQTKVRVGRHTYDENNVMVCAIQRVDGLLNFVRTGTAVEKDLLPSATRSRNDYEEYADSVRQLQAEGKSMAQIADALGISKSKVQRLIRSLANAPG